MPIQETSCRCLIVIALLASHGQAAQAEDLEALRQQVEATETAFAATMAQRDHAAFVEFLDEDTIFFAGEQPLRGKSAVAAAWARYYEGEAAPFSWAPATVVVRPGGQLALSSGPVLGPDGQQIAVFQSIWQRQADGSWKIIFDKGAAHCAPPPAAPAKAEG